MAVFSIYFILIAFLASFLYFIYDKKNKPLKLFGIFLFISFIIELTNLYLSLKNISNVLLYDFFTTFEFIFYIFIIREFLHHTLAKKIYLFIIYSYLIAALVNIFLIQGIHKFHTITYALGCLIIVFCCAYYFLETLLKPTPVTLVRMPDFWICSGLLFFYAVSFPIYGFTNFVMSLPGAFLRNFNLFIQILNIILYTMFSIAFLCRFKVTKSPLSLYLEPY